MELKKYKLGEILDVTRGASLSGEFYAAEGEYVRLTCGNFDYQNNCFKENRAKDNLYYTGDFKLEFLMKEGDIITPLTEQAIGLLGSTAIIPESGKYIQSQDVAKIVCKEHLLDKDFAFYLVSSNHVKRQLSAAAQQTKIRHTSPDKIKDCTVWIPELEEQKRIGKLLRTIDLKIELNRQINHNLEAMAKQLYDYWFVQFDFPNEEGKPYKSSGGEMVWNEKLKREIPKGWGNMSIGDYAPCKSGYAFKSNDFGSKGIPVIKIGNIQENYTLDMADSQCIDEFDKALFLAKRYDLIIAMTGATIGKFAISQRIYWVNQRVGRFDLGNTPLLRLGFLFNSLKQEYFREQIFQIACGCAQPNISAEQIDSISILKPNDIILNQFNKICEPLLELQSENYLQLEELTKQRDELLPLLMNGQITIK
ncbi:restriction endonuclease subunit S [Parabacteroides sp. AF48-14]|uniref:restriction endonuclease subunit S n=1 Tax=Parabacteroides sp. AF48-14 TaxID=2292052 RepID=UPI000F00B5EB|nr:restriction endonuclease subunit S [Parabacteroides sp. AF48-14]RHO70583.1 restriction endonuclease subunit S [Parabacteroides sp. AF48-14]